LKRENAYPTRKGGVFARLLQQGTAVAFGRLGQGGERGSGTRRTEAFVRLISQEKTPESYIKKRKKKNFNLGVSSLKPLFQGVVTRRVIAHGTIPRGRESSRGCTPHL